MSGGMAIRRDKQGELPAMVWALIIIASIVFLVMMILTMTSISTKLSGG